ncbi:MAG: TlpA disulfide reductase family protein [Nitrospiraceae bacterium]|nr:TlpA disulfide reductase family protein [Nitrospiraceae bacterium]
MKSSVFLSDGSFVRNSFIAIGVSLILAFVPACKKEKTTTGKEVSLPAVGNRAPIFTLKDLNGNNVSLSGFKGKIVVMDFWATWCSWCKKTTQELEKIHKDYESKGVVVLGISMDSGGDAEHKVKEFAKQYNLSYLMLMDDDSISKFYGVNKIPTSFILNKEHMITRIYPGYLPGLRERIVEAIEESLPKS